MKEGQLRWIADGKVEKGKDPVYFFVDIAGNLMDLDFHIINEAGWKNMKCPAEGTPAQLVIAAGTPFTQLVKALDAIETKGGYKLAYLVMSKS
jgi:hypothetical protein